MPRPSFLPLHAFTLIELLIVVAIIAILAAIAVPNFLEAQTRAKVSRDMADMRSLATAVEAYQVDNNRYPADWLDVAPAGGLAAAHISAGESLIVTTTPVAHITSIPRTSFAPFMTEFTSALMALNALEFEHFFYEGPSVIDGFYIPFAAMYPLFPFDLVATEWILSSPGPNRTYDAGGSGFGISIYDSSNGTISEGNIYRTGPGGTVPR